MRTKETTINNTGLNPAVKRAQARLQQFAMALPVRSDLHIARKVWHAGLGLMIVAIYSAGISHNLALGLLATAFFLDLAVEALRLRNPIVNECVTRIMGPFLRNHEVNGYSTIPYFIAAVFFAIAVFPKPVATLAMLYLALGDPTASFFGVLCKKNSIPLFNNKSLQGSLSAFSICALVTYIYLGSVGGLDGLSLIRMTLLGGFAGAVAEALPLDIDDNFSIPVVSGFIMWAGFLLIQFL